MISFNKAYQQTLDRILPIDTEKIDVSRATGRVLAEDLYALVDSPSIDVSLKDGYAIQSRDIQSATSTQPIHLKLLGVSAAGDSWDGEVISGTGVRILSGAPIPEGATAVLSNEFSSDDGQTVTATNHSEPGRNILSRGADTRADQHLLSSGIRLLPTQVGLIAAAGHGMILVHENPKVAIIATGDEVIAPGERMSEGKIYASNLVTLAAWCEHFGMAASTCIVEDQAETLHKEIDQHIAGHDALLTSGGAWTGDRDLIVSVLDRLGWEKVYHRVRIGPGKAIAFGLLQGKPIFCLPGGPPSNHMAFLQLALPGLHKLSGCLTPGLQTLPARVGSTVHGMKSWTQFIHGTLEIGDQRLVFQPIQPKSRLEMMAQTTGILMIPEGTETIHEGTIALVQKLN